MFENLRGLSNSVTEPGLFLKYSSLDFHMQDFSEAYETFAATRTSPEQFLC